MSLVAAWLAKHYGGVIGHRCDRSIGTLTTRDHHALAVAQLEPRVDRALDVAALLGRLAPGAGHRDSEGRVVINVHGAQHVLVDLGMRMLEPVELFRCQGFPNNYVVDRGVDERGTTIALTKSTQTRLCGNSVAPPVVEALVRANVLQEVTA
jgi:DNA (cytosine-5)-methyltransferase 1